MRAAARQLLPASGSVKNLMLAGPITNLEHLMTLSRSVIALPAAPELIMRMFYDTKSGIVCLDWSDGLSLVHLDDAEKTVTCILNRWLLLLALYVRRVLEELRQ
jgi:hypothetical protein